MTSVDLNPDTAHSPERTVDTAAVAADCLRLLVYATKQGRGGLVHPADVYDLTAQLCTILTRLGTLADCLDQWLMGELRAGRLKMDSQAPDANVEDAVSRAVSAFAQIAETTPLLHSAAQSAWSAVSRIATN